MGKIYEPDKVINGTWGELWVNDDFMAEATGLEAKVTLEKQRSTRPGRLQRGIRRQGLTARGQ